MGRLINPDGVGKQRTQLLRAVLFTLRALATRPAIDAETQDMVAFMALALNEIHETIDVTCAAWEKRDYWLKADQFRREWAWAGRIGARLDRVALGNEWQNLPALMVELSKHLEKVELPKRNKLGTPWAGALERLKVEREYQP
ncbi:MAG: hypothetical protein IT317_17480 [Anaerolineales bacterium]|nr:hypothetical protein [Anaerolineales bacterium]